MIPHGRKLLGAYFKAYFTTRRVIFGGVSNENTATNKNIKNICLLCMYSMMLLDITSQRHIKIEADKSCFFNGWLETMPKDAP